MARQYTSNIINESIKTLAGIISVGSLDLLFDGKQDALNNYITLKKDPKTTENIVIGFRFPATKLIGKITLNSRKDYVYVAPDPTTGVPTEYTTPYANESIRYFNLFGSNDATTLQNGTWKNILSTYAGRSNGVKQTFEINNPEEFRFYKIEIVDNYGATNDLNERIVSPVEIEMMEVVVPVRYLIEDAGELKVYSHVTESWSIVGNAPATIENFNSDGMMSLAGIPWNDLTATVPNVLAATYYKDKEYEAEMIAIPTSRIIHPVSDITLVGVSGINSIKFTGEETNGGMVRMAISTDKGQSWKIWDNGSFVWSDIDISNETELRGFGMSMEMISNLTREDWDKLMQGIETIRFAYYFEQDIYTDKAEIDQFEMNVEMLGAWSMAMPGVDYTYSYPSSTDLLVTLMTDGSYKINY